MENHFEQTRPASRIIWPAIGSIIAIVIVISAVFFFLKKPASPTTPLSPAPSNPVHQQNVTSTIPVPTSTTTEPEQPPTTPTPSTHHLGDTVQFFLHDSAIFTDPKDPQRSFTVTAAEFTDSRCPQGVECIWAGELGIRLTISPSASSTTEDVRLGWIRAKTADALGLHFTLNEIVESEGGVNAHVTVE